MDTKYDTQLAQKVEQILSLIAPVNLIPPMLQDIAPYRQAMTHISVSGQPNYEGIETQGDKVLAGALIQYLRKAFPNVDSPDVYTNFVAYYLSKDYLSKLSIDFGLVPLIRIAEDIKQVTIDIAEDVFEALAGAIFERGNDIGVEVLGYPTGQILIYNLITFIFNQVDLSLNESKESPITQLTNRANQLKIKAQLYNISGGNGDERRRYYIYTDMDSLQKFRGISFDADTELKRQVNTLLAERHLPTSNHYVVLARGEGDTMHDAKIEASNSALNYLNEIGLTADYAVKYNEATQPSAYRDLIQALKQYYDDISFKNTPLRSFETLSLILGKPKGTARIISIAHIIRPKTYKNTSTKTELVEMALAKAQGKTTNVKVVQAPELNRQFETRDVEPKRGYGRASALKPGQSFQRRNDKTGERNAERRGEVRPGQAVSNQAISNQAISNQAISNQVRPSQGQYRPYQPGPSRAISNQPAPNQVRPNQAISNQPRQYQPRPAQLKPSQIRPAQSNAFPTNPFPPQQSKLVPVSLSTTPPRGDINVSPSEF